jgi:hypothetical protein
MKKYRGAIARVLLAVFLLALLIIPVGTAYAETPLSISIVASGVGSTGLGSPFQHHSFIDDGTSWVFYQADAVNQVVGSWSDDGTTWVALAPIVGCNTLNMTMSETHGGQFDTWWNASTHRLSFAVVNTSVNASTIQYRAYTVDSTAHTLTPLAGWVTAVSGVANVAYRNPVICENNAGYPFITYGYVKNGSSDVYVTTTNSTVTWLPEVGFPMYNLSTTGNKAMYGSVIPLYTSMTNVSVQYADYNGSVYKISQCNLKFNGTAWNKDTVYNIDTSGWYLPSDAQWNYNAVSIPESYGLSINYNDVVIQCSQTTGAVYRTFTNRRANESDAWGSSGAYARNFGQGGWALDFIGAMGIRNAIYSIVYSGWDMSGGSLKLYSNDFSATTGNWSGITNVTNDTKIPYISTMSDYKADTTGHLGFLYGTLTDNRLMYGLYGPTAPSTVPTSVNMMAWLVILVFGALICLVLLAYGASEAIKTGRMEFVKIAIVGLISIIIASTIVAALL